jgi:hypothetical protein
MPNDATSYSPAVKKALYTAKWATTMTKWAIGFETGGRKVGPNVKPSRRWQLVPFLGPHGGGIGRCC